MAIIQADLPSKALGMMQAVSVILPQLPSADEPARRFPVCVLLHNLSMNHTIWPRMTGIERYAARLGLAVVMPDSLLSSYADMAHGGRYFTYIADELLPAMRRLFPLSYAREETMIAGCSMGGYGAIKIGLNRPETFGTIGSLSCGYTSITTFIGRKDDRGLSLQYLTFEEDGLARESADTAEKARRLARGEGPAPRIFISCGSEDRILLENAREARDFFSAIPGDPFDFVYEEHPGGHNWTYWDSHICDFFRYAGYAERTDTIF